MLSIKLKDGFLFQKRQGTNGREKEFPSEYVHKVEHALRKRSDTGYMYM